jgi:hypothetical protein
MATRIDVSKPNQPFHPHFLSGTAILFVSLVGFLAIALFAINTLSSVPGAGTAALVHRSLDATATRYQGSAEAYVPLTLGATGTWAARYEGMAESFASNKPISQQALKAWSARYAELTSKPLSPQAIAAWTARYKAYSMLAVSASPAATKISPLKGTISQRAANAWAEQYTGMAKSYVPELISPKVSSAWASRYMDFAKASALTPALNAWAARYQGLAGSSIVNEPVSQPALAAWAARYTAMLDTLLGKK